MIADAFLQLSGTISGTTVAGQTIATSGSVVSTNTVDLSTARDLGEGCDIYGRFQITTAVAGGTAVEFQIIAADDAALTTNVTVLATTGAVATAALTTAYRSAVALSPRLRSNGQRYLGARYVITGTNTAGAVFGDVGIEVQDGQKFYANGFVVA